MKCRQLRWGNAAPIRSIFYPTPPALMILLDNNREINQDYSYTPQAASGYSLDKGVGIRNEEHMVRYLKHRMKLNQWACTRILKQHPSQRL